MTQQNTHSPTLPAEYRIRALREDPTFPFWGKDVITAALERDCVDAAHVLQALAAVFADRADEILAGAR